ncbi:MAG: HAMP domain-containing sensor histidine kinase [Gemmatimonadales bacterium]
MRSLRSQLALLVMVVVAATVAVLALYTRRSAQIGVRAIVERAKIGERALDTDAIEAAYRTGGWPAVEAAARRDSAQMIVIDADGRVRVSPDPSWLGARAKLAPDGMLTIDLSGAGSRTAIALRGATPFRTVAGDTAGYAFGVPLERRITDSTERHFTTAYDRRLWLPVLGLLLAAAVAAVFFSGRVLEPLGRFAKAVDRVGAGDYGARVGELPTSEFRPLGHAIDQLAQDLERSEATRRRLIRDVAHELRTPLTNLRGQIEALQDKLREPTPEALASLHEEATLLERLVDDLGELARADAGQLSIDRRPLPLEPEARRAATGFVQSGRVPASAFEIVIPDELSVSADPDRLGQIFRNVIENAITHGRADAPITIAARAVDGQAAISITDRGRGIAEEHIGRVFERLYRSDPARARAGGGGAGLGLAIVKSLVEAHGGTASIESALGQGTTVTFTLPLGGDTQAPLRS